jgi:protein-disulfide isomerase
VPPKPRSSTNRTSFDRRLVVAVGVAIAVVVALVAASVLLRGGDDTTAPTSTGDTSVVDGIPQQGTVLGDPAAKVTLLQYEDMQCPYCRQYTAALFPMVAEQYVRTGDVKVDFRGLAILGDDSTQALRAVLAAAKQNKAWQLIELLYANQGEENSGWVTKVLIDDLASSIDELDVEQMNKDAESPAIQAQIDAVRAEAEQREVGGTPWFFVKAPDGSVTEVTPQGLDAAKLAGALDAALQG